MSDPSAIIDEFCILCERAWMDFCLYKSVVETDAQILALYKSTAPLFFGDLNRILIDNLTIQFCKITDPAGTGKKSNLTTNYILDILPWPDTVAGRLREVNDRLIVFRKYIEHARSKRTVHTDFVAQIQRWPDLGCFPKGADSEFLKDLQEFVNIAYGHYHNGEPHPIDVAMSTDTHQLIRAMGKSVLFDRCLKCTEAERNIAVLDYEARSGL